MKTGHLREVDGGTLCRPGLRWFTGLRMCIRKVEVEGRLTPIDTFVLPNADNIGAI